MDVATSRAARKSEEPPPPALKITGRAPAPPARSSMTAMEVNGSVYRIEFWPDERWERIPPGSRPRASRAHSDDGWFAITPA